MMRLIALCLCLGLAIAAGVEEQKVSPAASLLAFKQKLQVKADHRKSAEASQQKSLLLEKLQLQRELQGAAEYQRRSDLTTSNRRTAVEDDVGIDERREGAGADDQFSFGGSVDLSGGVTSLVNKGKEMVGNAIDSGVGAVKGFLGINDAPADAVEPPAEEDCDDGCPGTTEAEQAEMMRKQRALHAKYDRDMLLREKKERDREALEQKREEEMERRMAEEAEKDKQNKEDDDKPDYDNANDNGLYPDKPLRYRGKQRICKNGNCWYAPINVLTEGLDVGTPEGTRQALEAIAAGTTGQFRDGIINGFEQGINQMLYFKDGFNIGYKEGKESLLKQQQAQANRRPIISINPTLQSMTSGLADKAIGAINGAMDAGKNALLGAASASIKMPSIKAKASFSLWLEESEKITKQKNHQTQQNLKIQESHKKGFDATLPEGTTPDPVVA